MLIDSRTYVVYLGDILAFGENVLTFPSFTCNLLHLSKQKNCWEDPESNNRDLFPSISSADAVFFPECFIYRGRCDSFVYVCQAMTHGPGYQHLFSAIVGLRRRDMQK